MVVVVLLKCTQYNDVDKRIFGPGDRGSIPGRQTKDLKNGTWYLLA